ncbi:MAG TPA: hypothetical protein VF588_07245 [Pyrinomonadaceae bacterium]
MSRPNLLRARLLSTVGRSLRRADVVLLDNLRVHHASGVEKAIRSTRARVL